MARTAWEYLPKTDLSDRDPFGWLCQIAQQRIIDASRRAGALKRDAGVRSWGGRASVTGAVGLLDRVAPLCFAAPVFFHAVRWYFGL